MATVARNHRGWICAPEPDPPAEGQVASVSNPPAIPRVGARPHRWWRFAAALVVLLIATGAIVKIVYGEGSARHTVSIRPLAVLPLENLLGDRSPDYFADGMTDELIIMLAKNAPLRVVSRTSVMQYKNVHRPLRDVARELGVDGILEGSFARSTNRVHVNV